jgi:CPA1 family monovalent cation:H+ antiporter
VAVVVRGLRSAVQDPLLVNGISLATPFAAYLLGEELRVSGVLAVAVAGLMIGHDTPRFTSGASRLQASAVWHLADFLISGFVFLLIGQQVAPVVRGLKAYPTATIVAAVAVSLGVVLLLRPLWLGLTQTLPRALRTRRGNPAASGAQYLTGCEIAVLSWSGTRGVISLAAIFTLPLVTSNGHAFPGRDLLLFCTYLIVVVTLVGQGVTFAWVTKALGVRADPADAALVRTEARAAAVQAGLSRLDQIAADWQVPGPALAALRAHLDQQARRYRRWLDQLEAGEDAHPSSSPGQLAAQQARRR